MLKYIFVASVFFIFGCSKKTESPIQNNNNKLFKIQIEYFYNPILHNNENDLFIQFSKESNNNYSVSKLNLVTNNSIFFEWYSAINRENANLKLSVPDSAMKFRLRFICENRILEDLYIYDDGLIINYNYYGLPKIFKEDSNAIFFAVYSKDLVDELKLCLLKEFLSKKFKLNDENIKLEAELKKELFSFLLSGTKFQQTDIKKIESKNFENVKVVKIDFDWRR